MNEVQKAYAELSTFYDKNNIIYHKAQARNFDNWDSNISVKSDFGRQDFEYFRSNGIPKTIEDILKRGNECYERVGIVKSVIDLMGDFASQGIRLQHPNEKIERFYQRWFENIDGVAVTERFLNYLYRLGNVVLNRQVGKISLKQQKELEKARGEAMDSFDPIITPKKNIPIGYYFLNPANIRALDPEVTLFSGKRRYAIQLEDNFKKAIIRAVDSGNKESIPNYIIEAIKKGQTQIPIDMENILTYHYKKDDWDYWAKPITYSIFDSLIMLERMQLADLAALDGAISNIRLWTLGKLDGPNSILPTPEIMEKLKNILANNNGCGTLDLVWGPELSFSESKTDVHKFLGSEKYKVTFDLIYDGLGIANALRSGGNSNGATNFISLKTLIERLRYGRNIVEKFWKKEIELVQKAMGFRIPASIMFDNMLMSDEAAEKQLIINLLDRNVISEEAVRERFNYNNLIENTRIKKEQKERKTRKKPEKASPYHNPDKEHDIKKGLLSSGAYTPSELGYELGEKKSGEKSPAEIQSKYKPAGQNGRPKNVTETKKRKKKPVDRQLSGTKGAEITSLSSWANEAQILISEVVTPAYLGFKQKKNVRSLTTEEKEELESIKLNVLFSSKSYEILDDQKVYAYLNNSEDHSNLFDLVQKSKAEFVKNNNKQPTVAEIRNMQSMIYALHKKD